MGQRCYLGAVRGSKRTKASDRRERHQLMSPCFPRSLPPSPQVSRFSLESLPPNFLSLSSPTFPWPHRSLCLTLCVPGFSVCLSTSLPCSCLQGSAPKRLISHAHPRDPLTLDSADPGGTGRRFEARGDGVWDVPSSPGPLLPAAAPAHRPAIICWVRVPTPSPWLQAPRHHPPASPAPLPWLPLSSPPL